MTTEIEARELVYERFTANWTATTVYILDPDPTDPPSDGSSWVRFGVRHTLSNQETLGPIGARKFFRRGRIFLQVFTDVGVGWEASDTIVRAFRTLFEGVTFSAIRVYDVQAREIGSEGDYKQANADAEFVYDETK